MALDILGWWLAIQLIGVAGLPLATRLLRTLPDRGYSFAKSLGLLLVGYGAWLLAMLGLAPFAVPTLVACMLAVAGIGLWLHGGPRVALQTARSELTGRWPSILASEMLFLGALLAVVWMRGHDSTPWGTERPMDFAFFNSIQRSGSFPPNDPWLAGYSINYYYFGYLLMAVMARLTGIAPTVAYNLSLALIFALTAQGVAGLIANLMALSRGKQATDEAQPVERQQRRRLLPVASFLFPLLGVIFVLVAANQSGALQVALGDERVVTLDDRQLVSALGQALGGANTIVLPYPAESGDFGSFNQWQRADKTANFSWWWPSRSLWDEYRTSSPEQPPSAQRRYNITEFPLFSFRLGDMHPHVMALPFGLLAAALALATLTRSTLPTLADGRLGWADLLLSGLILGSLYAINSWDLPTYLLLYAGSLVLLSLRLQHNSPSQQSAFVDAENEAGGWVRANAPTTAGDARAWLAVGKWLLALLVAAYLLFLPFHLTFRSLVGGAAPLLDLPLLGRLTSVVAPYAASRSGLQAFVIIFGLFAVPIVAFVYLSWRPSTGGISARLSGRTQEALGIVAGRQRADAATLAPRLLPWLPPLLLLVGLLVGFPLLGLLGLLVFALRLAYERRGAPAESFALLLAALGCAVLFGTELIYIRDLFENRMNTIFKFYYQIWLLWGTVAPFALWWALAHTRGPRRAVALASATLTFGLLAGALVYPWLTLRDLGRGDWIGLNGRTPREQSEAGQASVEWLRRNAAPGSVVLEAVEITNLDQIVQGAPASCGGSYNGAGFAGVSSATGLPTVLGWDWHEVQWRGGDQAAAAELGPRCADVNTIYSTSDPNQARELLQKYGVDYVYVGGLERSLYAPESLAKFAELGESVFADGEVVVYRLR